MRTVIAFASSVCTLLALAAVGCGAGSNGNGGSSLDGGNGDDSSTTLDVGGDTSSIGDVSNDTTAPQEAYVYGHSADTLYRLDTKALSVTMIGQFTDAAGGAPITDVTDIALDKDGTMYGVTFGDLYRIDYKSGGVRCTHLATLSTSFNGLTFVPAGTIDPAKEILIGIANDGGWWRVDVATGASSATLTQLGSYGGGVGSSGDSVGIIGDQVYATVTGLGADDHVIVVDPKTGKMKSDLGGTGVSGLYGVGYWGGVMYGFASDGSLYSIDLKTAKTTNIPITNAPAGGWWGAGVTTSAPTTIH